jgi:hypothetical protein
MYFSTIISVHFPSQNNSEVISISSTSSSNTESEASSSYSEYLSDESYVEGDPNAYYGGYGHWL